MVFKNKHISVGLKDERKDKALIDIAAMMRLMTQHPIMPTLQEILLDGEKATPETIANIMEISEKDTEETLEMTLDIPVYLVKTLLGIVYKSNEVLGEIDFMSFDECIKHLEKEQIIGREAG